VARASRGSVLVITLLVILALTGLALVALSSAATGAITATTFNVQKQVNYVTELAVNAAVEEMACQPENYLAPLTFVQQVAGSAQATQMRWDGLTFCGLTPQFFGPNDFGRRDTQPAFQVIFTDNRLASQEAGFEAGGAGSAASDQPCHIRLRMEATGIVNVPGRASNSFAINQAERANILRRAVGYVTVGPFLNPVICANAGAL
jgi:hypothetical protein